MVREENLENAVRALRQLKEDLGVFPGLITCDFAPNLIAAIKLIYGADVIQIDLFHVMRELNNGIKADLQIYREQHFDAERHELRNHRNWVNSIQKIMNEGNNFTTLLKIGGKSPKINPTHNSSSHCAKFTFDVFEILKLNAPNKFFRELREFINGQDGAEDHLTYFSNRILKVIPKKRFTKKGMLCVKKKIFKKLKTYYLRFRKPIDDKSV